MSARRVLILGGRSAIAEQVARILAAEGASLYLTGRDAGGPIARIRTWLAQ